MIIMKFGGTSVGSPDRIKEVADILVGHGDSLLVVLSAMSGTTNTLVEIANCYRQGADDQAEQLIAALEARYMQHIEQLYSTPEMRSTTKQLLHERFQFLRSFAGDYFSSFEEKQILAQGEIMSTNMMVNYLLENGHQACLLDALQMVYTNKDGDPDLSRIQSAAQSHIQATNTDNKRPTIFITQGFICTNAFGEIDNLQRGGSDYTATLLGAALHCEEVQIWTDVDGIHTADPRIVEHTQAIREVSFDVAAELARFGAKILHPTCVTPAQQTGVPIRLKYTMQPAAAGTLICDSQDSSAAHASRCGITAIASKEPLALVRLKPRHNLPTVQLLKRVCDTLIATQQTPDLMALSGADVLLCLSANAVEGLRKELHHCCDSSKEDAVCLIAIVGNYSESPQLQQDVLAAIRQIDSSAQLGGISPLSITLVVKADDKQRTLVHLHKTLLER